MSDLSVISLDGQVHYIFEKSYLSSHKNVLEIESERIIYSEPFMESLRWMIDFVVRHENFQIGFFKMPNRLKVKTGYCPLFKLNNEWIRVQIETVRCVNCEWRGNIANPTVPGLFDIVPNRIEVMNKVHALKSCPCPKCHKPLERKAIWTE